MHLRRIVAREHSCDIAILAVDAAHAFKPRTGCTPNRGRCPLLRRLFIFLWIDNGVPGLINDFTGVDLLFGHVPDQSSYDATRMHGKGANSFTLTDRI